MARCCGSTCACKLQGGEHILVTGTGTAQDPFIIDGDTVLNVVDNPTFDLVLSGNGTAASPWSLAVTFAATARLDDLPDVNAGAPTNGQVLAWDSSTNTWTPAAPTTAAAGAVQHDTSLAGDGSIGTPLQVSEDPARFLGTTATGLGLNDAGVNQLVRQFTDATARAAAVPVPELNSLSALDTAPGLYDYWDGAEWLPVADRNEVEVASAAFLELSGPYAAGSPITQFSKLVSITTDGAGLFDVLDATDLSGRAGVLSVMFQETGTLAWRAVLFANATKVSATAFRLSDGTPYAGQALTGTVIAWLY